jgi:hypothetical protein
MIQALAPTVVGIILLGTILILQYRLYKRTKNKK